MKVKSFLSPFQLRKLYLIKKLGGGRFITKEMELLFLFFFLFFFPAKFTMKCQSKICLFHEVKSTAHLEEKIEDDNVKLTDNLGSVIDCDIFPLLMLLDHQVVS